MAKIRFTQDFRGKLTNEVFYQVGDVADFPADTARMIVDFGRAEYVVAPLLTVIDKGEVKDPAPEVLDFPKPTPEPDRPAFTGRAKSSKAKK